MTVYSQTLTGDRSEPPGTADERKLLTTMLDWQRRTLELKCADVPAGRLSVPAVPPSSLTLHGLVRHLAGVERWWFRIQFAGEDVPMLHYSDDNPDADFAELDGDVGEALDLWRAECERSREVVVAAQLGDTGTRRKTGEAISLRWVPTWMVAEYARHNGHADLLRERLDGATGH